MVPAGFFDDIAAIITSCLHRFYISFVSHYVLFFLHDCIITRLLVAGFFVFVESYIVLAVICARIVVVSKKLSLPNNTVVCGKKLNIFN